MTTPRTKCVLCGSEGPLRRSHIVPRFVVSHIQSESLTGFLRAVDRPNLRLQDAFRADLLCEACEQRLGVWESGVARGVFPALTTAPDNQITYDSGFSRFVVSVLWRVLVWRLEKFLQTSPQFEAQCRLVEREWRQFLLGAVPTPGRGTCHAVVLGTKLIIGAGDTVSETSLRFQRYLAMTVDIDVVFDGQHLLTYAKLHRLLLFGFVQGPASAGAYRSSRIGLQRGVLGPGAYQMPAGVFVACIENAKSVFASIQSVSPRQQGKIEESIQEATKKRINRP